jgi:hypothetical protein
MALAEIKDRAGIHDQADGDTARVTQQVTPQKSVTENVTKRRASQAVDPRRVIQLAELDREREGQRCGRNVKRLSQREKKRETEIRRECPERVARILRQKRRQVAAETPGSIAGRNHNAATDQIDNARAPHLNVYTWFRGSGSGKVFSFQSSVFSFQRRTSRTEN